MLWHGWAPQHSHNFLRRKCTFWQSSRPKLQREPCKQWGEQWRQRLILVTILLVAPDNNVEDIPRAIQIKVFLDFLKPPCPILKKKWSIWRSFKFTLICILSILCRRRQKYLLKVTTQLATSRTSIPRVRTERWRKSWEISCEYDLFPAFVFPVIFFFSTKPSTTTL